MYLERFLEQTVLQLLKVGDRGISGCRAERVGGDPSAGEAACPIVSFSLQFLRLKLVLPRGEWEQKPRGQVRVAAEREPKPSGTRCSALCSLQALAPGLSLDRRWQQRAAWGWGPEPPLTHPSECSVLRGDSDPVPRSRSAQTMEETGLIRREQLRTTSNHRMPYSQSLKCPRKSREGRGKIGVNSCTGDGAPAPERGEWREGG